MLQDGPSNPPLSTAGDLHFADHDIPGNAPLETKERLRIPSGMRSRTKGCGDSQVAQSLHDRLVNGPVEGLPADGQRMAPGHDEAVSPFVVVENCPAPSDPANNRTTQTGQMLLEIPVSLKVTQREGRLCPAV